MADTIFGSNDFVQIMACSMRARETFSAVEHCDILVARKRQVVGGRKAKDRAANNEDGSLEG